MAKPSDAHETAAAMEMAKHRLKERAHRDGEVTPPTPVDTLVTDQYAFAFDIDGVLIRGGKPIPQAVEAMKVLNGQNEYGVKVYVAAYHPLLCSFSPAQAIHIRHERRRQDGAREMPRPEQTVGT